MSPGYIHGTDPEEQRRLSRLNELLNGASLEALGLQPGDRVLDLGSGLGQLSRAMARRVGVAGCVVGVELSSDQLAEARRLAAAAGEESLVEFRQGDARTFPLSEEEWGSFDVVHTRFLLEHVSEPEEVVRSMVRAAVPGGRLVLEDDDHDVLRIWPEPVGFRKLWQAYMRTYEKLGNDPYIGRRLVSLLQESGAEPARNQWLFFGSCSGDPNFGAMVRNFVGILEGAHEAMVRHGLLDEPAVAQGIASLQEWVERPDAALWYARAWAEGRRPLGQEG